MRKLLLIGTALLLSFSMTGCGDGTSADAVNTPSLSSSEDTDLLEEDAVYGKITEVDGDTITIEVMSREKDRPSDGDRPSDPEGSGAPDGEDPSKPEGSGTPAGEAPSKPEGSGAPDQEGRGSKGLRGFSSTGESKTIVLTESVEIQQVSSSGEISEADASSLVEDVIVQLEYDGEELEVVTVQAMDNPSE